MNGLVDGFFPELFVFLIVGGVDSPSLWVVDTLLPHFDLCDGPYGSFQIRLLHAMLYQADIWNEDIYNVSSSYTTRWTTLGN